MTAKFDLDAQIPLEDDSRKPEREHTPPGKRQGGGFVPFFCKALIWGVMTYFMAKKFAVNHFWIVVLSVFLLSVPIALCGIYGNTIRQIRRLAIFAKRGLIFRWLSGRPLKVIFWICWALGSSFFMLVQFHTYNNLEWIVFFLVVPVFWIVFTISRRLIAHELRPYLVTNMALTWSRWLCPLFMLVIYVVLSLHLGKTPAYSSLQEAINDQKAAVADMTGSALVLEASQYLALYNGAKVYALGRLGSQDALWALALLGISRLVVFYNACALLSCFLIPGEEYRRMFGPLSDADKPQPLPLSRIAAIVAVITFVALFVYLPLFAYIEAWFQQTPEVARARQIIESSVIPKLEQIGDDLFREGTLAQLESARVEALRKVEVSLAHLEEQADRAFDRLEANVDGYLDWYYSLVGEYTRIANLLIGELEDYLIKKLEESLQQGDAFKELEAALNNALAAHESAQIAYQQAAQKIMDENRIDPGGSPVQVVQRMSLADVLNPPIHEDLISLQTRLLAGGSGVAITGVVTAVVIKKITGKLVGTNVLKLAAKALVKVALSKTAGTAGGTATGAFVGGGIGSVIPGLGTVAGAAIGGFLGGLAVGVGLDKMLLMLEESLNREEFKREILSAIRAARMEFKAGLKG
jgi:hypothetical protein